MTRIQPLLIAAFAALLLLPATPVRAQDAALASVTAQQYIVVDAETGEVFAEKLGDGRAGMASVTKLFTLMEAVQRAPMDLEVTALETDMFGSDSTKMTGFFPGARFTLEDLLYGMMLESGNDAAYAIARAVGAQPGDTEDQSVARFVGWMNERAASLGMTNTQLRNPHGLSEEGHYTTPRDLSAFLMYGLGVEPFVDVMVARSYVTSTGVEIFSINRSPEFIPDQIGGKTGYDNATGVLPRRGRRARTVAG
jgi:D-alanyl-D-alanine carboxypeptidase